MKRYQIVIAHRVCPKLATTATEFDDKFEMVKATSRSLLSALSGLKVKLFVILDGCDIRYRNLFRTTDLVYDIEIIETPAIGNSATFEKQIELLRNATELADYLYFSEDDYLYKPNAFSEMMEMLSQSGVDLVTPLDHPDRYSGMLLEEPNTPIRISSVRHWRKCSTTCLTFMAKSTDFKNYEDAFQTYAHGNLDCTMWLAITQDQIFSVPTLILNLIRFLLDKGDFNHILQLAAWKWSWRYILTHRPRTLWSPMPSLAYHLCCTSLPPTQTAAEY